MNNWAVLFLIFISSKSFFLFRRFRNLYEFIEIILRGEFVNFYRDMSNIGCFLKPFTTNERYLLRAIKLFDFALFFIGSVLPFTTTWRLFIYGRLEVGIVILRERLALFSKDLYYLGLSISECLTSFPFLFKTSDSYELILLCGRMMRVGL